MQTATLPELRTILRGPLADTARKLVKEGRVYKVRQDGDEIRGQVLAGLQPESATLLPWSDRVEWNCECGDHAVCAHVLGLLIYAANNDQLPPGAVRDVLRKKAAPEKVVVERPLKDAVRRGQASALDLFDNGLYQPSLFDDVLPLVEADSVVPGVSPAVSLGFLPESSMLSKATNTVARVPTPTRVPEAKPEAFNNTGLPDKETVFQVRPDQELDHRPDSFTAAMRGPAVLPDVLRQAQEDDPAFIEAEFVEPKPSLILHVSARLDRSEIQLSFDYGIREVDGHEKQHVFWIDRRVRKALKRNLDVEASLRQRFMQRIEPWLSWERGLYADLVHNTSVAEWGLTLSLTDFLHEAAGALVSEGWELRVAGKRIAGRATLKVRAEDSPDWFGLRAVVQLEGQNALDQSTQSQGEGTEHENADTGLQAPSSAGHGLINLDLSGESEAEGLVATDCGYVILTRADVRRLTWLRSRGMDESGLVAGSPLTASLADALYDQLENQDMPAVVAGRSAMAELKGILQVAYASVRSGEHEVEAEIDMADPPAGLKARLRIYQRLGYTWLRTLHKHGYGGILADDMGLGKTMQTLALLLSLKEEGQLGPCLLLAPVVTLPNWEAELAKFAPGLKVARHQGARRSQHVSELRSADLILVSYHTLKNDLDLFAAHEWDWVILDEAQYIKNASSQVFKAVRVLPAKHRLSLSGTPVENNSMELWAQFSFLAPGLLGSAEQFQEQFALPIERKGDQTAAGILRGLVAPFILRRRKEDVLAELPPKHELVHWIEMGSEQAEVYERHRQTYRDQLLGLLDEKGLAKTRMEVFKFLLRLRQLSIAPVLADECYADIPSAKLETLHCMLDELVAENNKVLVFSQFTSTLKLVSAELDRKGQRYALLTGSTPDRSVPVETFRNDPACKIFLLSLKAGGVGINLTQANYVVLLDPWWNPASESQAIDRAYRMGQQRTVTAYRYIVRNSIEEKILELQERKQNLQEALVSPDGMPLSGLSEAELRGLLD